MTKSFKSFLKEGKQFGITHVEDLDVNDFIDILKRIHKFDVAQKVDGANLHVGLDTEGKLYTSREQKGGARFYSVDDFPHSTAYDGFKTAHAAVEKVKKKIEDVLKPGQAINCEVLYGAQPNTVHYGKDGLNYLILLEPTDGDDPTLGKADIKKIRSALKDAKPSVNTEVGDTADGESIVYTSETSTWAFKGPDQISKTKTEKISFEKELKKLEAFLEKPNKVAKKLGHEFTNFDVVLDKSRDLTDERKVLNDTIMNDFKLPIKKQLMDLAAGAEPKLDNELGEDGNYQGIEGLVFTDPEGGSQFKVVNREEFTEVNKFFYEARTRIVGKILSIDDNKPIASRGGLIGDAKIRALKVLGLEQAALPSQAKKALAKFDGSTREELLSSMESSMSQLSLPSIKRKLQAVLISAASDLEDELNNFKKSVDEFKLELPDGKIVKYSQQIRKRTLLSFAEAKRHIHANLERVRKANCFADLVNIFLGRTIDKVVNENEDV